MLLSVLLVGGCVLVGPAPWVAEVNGADNRHPATPSLDMVRTGDASWTVSGVLYRTTEPAAQSLHGLAVLRVEDGVYVTHMTVTGGGTSLTCDVGPGPGFFLDGVCFDQDRNGYSVRVHRF